MTPLRVEDLVSAVREIHCSIRDDVVVACEAARTELDLARVAHDGPGDTLYAIDRVSEETLIEQLGRTIAGREPIELIAEGIEPDGRVILPVGTSPDAVRWRLLVDPIDGTRGLMYQKRSAWILTGIAPATGSRLRDCVAAVMTEIPLVKQHQCDQLSAIRGQGLLATRFDRVAGTSEPLRVAPSSSDTLSHGFAQISRFFPGKRDVIAAVDDAVMAATCGEPKPGKALSFEDQYLSTGGQFYELIVGHDRFVADIRPLLGPGVLCCHPYDCAALLVAEEAGVVITDLSGEPLDSPLDIHADVGWAGYANPSLHESVEPVLLAALEDHGLRPHERTTSIVLDGIAEDALWQGATPIHVARAPGRLDWLGGFGDYSGSLVLQLPLADAATCAVQLSTDDSIELHSLLEGERLVWSGSWSSLGGGRDLDRLRRELSGEWTAYLVGVAAVLAEWSGQQPVGFRARLTSSVPPGKGVSSSAAIEVSMLRALAHAQQIELDGPTLARLGQRAENVVVGAPCGIMDQMTSACGLASELLALRCQPAEIEGMLSLPPNLEIWGIDSGMRHAISGADYGSVRCATFMGKKMLGLSADEWLADVSPSHWEARLAEIPELLAGAAFLEEWGGIDDPLSRVDPERVYSVRACTSHPIRENHRVRQAAALLRGGAAAVGPLLGESMYLAHASYTACGIGSEATDAIVAAVRLAAADGAPLYGAKITGGGSGGSVAVLGDRAARPHVDRIASEQAERFGGGRILGGSSDGAMAVPVAVIGP